MMVALASVACSSPDRRSAEVVVESEVLEEATVFAISNWQKAVGPEMDWVLSNACGYEDRTCVRIRLAESDVTPYQPGDALKEEHPQAIVAGYTTGHIDHVDLDRHEYITVLPWSLKQNTMPLNLYSLLTHEIGHALGLKHIDEETRSGEPLYDVMYPMGSANGHDCIGPKTLNLYNSYYGTNHQEPFCW